MRRFTAVRVREDERHSAFSAVGTLAAVSEQIAIDDAQLELGLGNHEVIGLTQALHMLLIQTVQLGAEVIQHIACRLDGAFEAFLLFILLFSPPLCPVPQPRCGRPRTETSR